MDRKLHKKPIFGCVCWKLDGPLHANNIQPPMDVPGHEWGGLSTRLLSRDRIEWGLNKMTSCENEKCAGVGV